MNIYRSFSLLRPALAVLIVVLAAFVFDLAWSGHVPSWPISGFYAMGVAATLIVYAIVYGVLISTLYVTSLAITGKWSWLPGWCVFAVLYVLVTAGWQYFALTGFEGFQIGDRILVSDRTLTPAGWNHWFESIAFSIPFAALAAIALFFKASRNRDELEMTPRRHATGEPNS
jgi:hypothetical protein